MGERAEVDYEGLLWPELAADLAAMDLDAEDMRVLVAHVTDRLIGYFGSETIEIWGAKEGLHRHPMSEAAAVMIVNLAPVLELLEPDAISAARTSGEIAGEVRFPWEDRY